VEPDAVDLRGQPRPIRAQNLPWFREYLHPALETFFSRASTTTAPTSSAGRTRRRPLAAQFRIWMDALRGSACKGGVITTGDDAGYIYSVYGFG
jgi:hypothetical protein